MARMTDADHARWRDRNMRENAGYALKAGDRLKDRYGVRSTVVQVRIPEDASIEDHGVIEVDLEAGGREHYAGYGWEPKFRVERMQ